MVRYIKENEVEQLLTMPKAVALVEQALRDRAQGRAVDTIVQKPRARGVQDARLDVSARTRHQRSD